MNKVTIKTKSGKFIERNARITEWIDGNGVHSVTAQVGKHVYTCELDENGYRVFAY